ncbi:MAG: 2-oxo acid dehydrogenase subunit E2 [Bacteroidales bacterium]|nr:2-oxo acid dehydrogenase subunit E2 [Bacteroidales bacterium]
MAKFDVIMPKMGESVQEATITKWFVKVGDKVAEDDVLLEIATDKVDSEIPSPVEGIVVEVKYKENDVVPVGKVVAVIDLDGDSAVVPGETKIEESKSFPEEKPLKEDVKETQVLSKKDYKDSGRFYSPLVKSIAKVENISLDELNSIEGTGRNKRVTKSDLLTYIENRAGKGTYTTVPSSSKPAKASVSLSAGDEIVEMDRMRKIIADHMVMSKQVSPHVTNILEVDVTNLVMWRNKVKDSFQKREGEKITFLPIIIEATAKALKDFPGVNASVDGYNIILKKRINVGVAVALPTGNLIVPVIKNADQKNLLGITKDLNRLADAARNNKLSPDDIQDGTFSISNFGSFRNLMGTPIINQPQVAILAVGSIEKKPAVIETPLGDTIGIRHKMFLSLTYDHRVIDGALGGTFLRRLADYLEAFDMETDI